MPFIRQRELSLSLRARAEKDYKAKLRAALLDPGLSAEQRRDIQNRLAHAGQPRVYEATSAPLPGAIKLPEAGTLADPTPQAPKGRKSKAPKGPRA